MLSEASLFASPLRVNSAKNLPCANSRRKERFFARVRQAQDHTSMQLSARKQARLAASFLRADLVSEPRAAFRKFGATRQRHHRRALQVCRNKLHDEQLGSLCAAVNALDVDVAGFVKILSRAHDLLLFGVHEYEGEFSREHPPNAGPEVQVIFDCASGLKVNLCSSQIKLAVEGLEETLQRSLKLHRCLHPAHFHRWLRGRRLGVRPHSDNG